MLWYASALWYVCMLSLMFPFVSIWGGVTRVFYGWALLNKNCRNFIEDDRIAACVYTQIKNPFSKCKKCFNIHGYVCTHVFMYGIKNCRKFIGDDRFAACERTRIKKPFFTVYKCKKWFNEQTLGPGTDVMIFIIFSAKKWRKCEFDPYQPFM
jgi:hypothetical protein